MNRILVLSIATLAFTSPPAHSKNVPLEEATLTRIVNDVRVFDPKKGTSPARVSQTIKDDMGVKTGVKSRAELLFQDNTLTRLGAESFFTFNPGTREMSLSSGTLLLQVPKNHGGATIRAASVTASITGTTVLVENLPNKTAKFLVLEGSMRVSLKNKVGESLTLRPGQMIILPPKPTTIPNPANVDLRRLIQTSALVNPQLFSAKNSPAELPSMPLIAKAIGKQDKARKEGRLIETNIAIIGNGTKLATLSEATRAAIDSAQAGSPASDGRLPTSTDERLRAQDSVRTTAADLLAKAEASSATLTNSDTNGRTLLFGSRTSPLTNDVNVTKPIDLSTSQTSAAGRPEGRGGLLGIFTTKRARVDKIVEVSSNSPTRKSATGGSIHIESLNAAANDTGVEITNSGQLLSLLDASAPGPGGSISLVTAGSKINVRGKMVADRGAITIANPGTNGEIRVDGADIAADTIKVAAFGTDGSLKIRNSRISADSLMYLYGGNGTGGVFFEDHTLLDGNSLKFIAGREVKINNGKIVTIGGGPATVFTDNASYSAASGGMGTTTGRFERKEAPGVPHAPTLLPYANRP
jgi:hypothetical protein